MQTWHTQIRKRKCSKGFETFLEWFYFICLYFWDDCYIHILANLFQPSRVLFVKPSHCNVNLKWTLFYPQGIDWIKGSMTPVNDINISDSILWILYLLLEIKITPLCCLMIINVHSKNTYFNLSNFQHIPLSSGVNQNVNLGIFKSGWLNFHLKFLKIIHFSIGLQLACSIERHDG